MRKETKNKFLLPALFFFTSHPVCHGMVLFGEQNEQWTDAAVTADCSGE